MSGTILVTGGCGFIGSHFVRLLDGMYDGNIVIVDKMTYAGDRGNIGDIDSTHYDLCVGDIADARFIDDVFRRYRPCSVVNFAAETHVDRSITSAGEFAMTNFIGVQNLLDASLRHGVGRFLQVSTDEVYGDVRGNWRASIEDDKLVPSSPYSASKAAADLLALSYVRTHKMDVVITRCTNNYGSHQYPEKFIPLVVMKLMKGERVPVYGAGDNVRDWIYVTDHCQGIWEVLNNGKAGEVYNFAGGNMLENIEVVRRILGIMGKGEEMIEHVEDRKGHDRKYWVSYGKVKKELGWVPVVGFDDGLREVVGWYMKKFGEVV